MAILKRRRNPQAGTAAIEFGIVAPFLLVLLAGIVELGSAAHDAMQVQDAAEAGALYAGKYGWDAAGISAAVTSATNETTISATPAPLLFCGCPSAGGVATVVCTTTTCPDGSTPSQYARVSASMPYTPILTYLGLPIPDTLVGHALVRVE